MECVFIEVERALGVEGDVVSLFEAIYLVVVIIIVGRFGRHICIVCLHWYCFNWLRFIGFVRTVVVNGDSVVMVYGLMSRAVSW